MWHGDMKVCRVVCVIWQIIYPIVFVCFNARYICFLDMFYSIVFHYFSLVFDSLLSVFEDRARCVLKTSSSMY